MNSILYKNNLIYDHTVYCTNLLNINGGHEAGQKRRLSAKQKTTVGPGTRLTKESNNDLRRKDDMSSVQGQYVPVRYVPVCFVPLRYVPGRYFPMFYVPVRFIPE